MYRVFAAIDGEPSALAQADTAANLANPANPANPPDDIRATAVRISGEHSIGACGDTGSARSGARSTGRRRRDGRIR